jgi:WD40 repeat protein
VADLDTVGGSCRTSSETATAQVVILFASLIAGAAVVYHGTGTATAPQEASALPADQSGERYDRLNPVPAMMLFFSQESVPAVFAFPPDRSLIAAASPAGTAHVWAVRTGQLTAMLRLSSSEGSKEYLAASTVFSPDGRYLLVTASDTTSPVARTRVWEVQSGRLVATLHLGLGRQDYQEYAAFSTVFSPDGRHLLIAASDQTARTWEADTWQQSTVFEGHAGAVRTAAFSPDGQRILTASDDKTARIWDAATGKEIAVLAGHVAAVKTAAFSPDGKRIVTASDDRTARIWDAAAGKEIAVLTGHAGAVRTAAFSPDGQRILTASDDKTARIWDLRTGQGTVIPEGELSSERAIAFSPSGGIIAKSLRSGRIELLNAETKRPVDVLEAPSSIAEIAFCPDGRLIAFDSKALHVWNRSDQHE